MKNPHSSLEIEIPPKSEKENVLLEKYKGWIESDEEIPQVIIDRFINDLDTLKLKP